MRFKKSLLVLVLSIIFPFALNSCGQQQVEDSVVSALDHAPPIDHIPGRWPPLDGTLDIH